MFSIILRTTKEYTHLEDSMDVRANTFLVMRDNIPVVILDKRYRIKEILPHSELVTGMTDDEITDSLSFTNIYDEIIKNGYKSIIRP
jgi:hypothetical protein